jgi:hypothetical protein
MGHILSSNCLLKHVNEGKKIEGRIEVTGRRERRRTQLLDDLTEKRGYWNLNEEALDRTVWRTRFGRGYGPVVRQTTERIMFRGSLITATPFFPWNFNLAHRGFTLLGGSQERCPCKRRGYAALCTLYLYYSETRPCCPPLVSSKAA